MDLKQENLPNTSSIEMLEEGIICKRIVVTPCNRFIAMAVGGYSAMLNFYDAQTLELLYKTKSKDCIQLHLTCSHLFIKSDDDYNYTKWADVSLKGT